MKYVLSGMAAVLALAFTLQSYADGEKDKEKPKFTIKEVMAEAHKSGLWKKIAAGDADKEDRVKLAELYKALTQQKPPAGDVKEWQKTTKVMHQIAEAAIKDAQAGKKLKVNCQACHEKFKE